MASPSTILILAADCDQIARRSVRALGSRLKHKLELCTVSDLAHAAYVIEPRPPSGGNGEIVLRDGRIFLQQELAALWNRLTTWPDRLAGQSAGAHVALAAWITGFTGSLIGSVGIKTPQACANWTRLHWALAAARAGLQVPSLFQRAGPQVNGSQSSPLMGERIAVLVLGTRVIADFELPATIRSACQRLGQQAGGILEVRLIPDSCAGPDGADRSANADGLLFAEAIQNPDPFRFGPAGQEALAALLGAKDLEAKAAHSNPTITPGQDMEGAR